MTTLTNPSISYSELTLPLPEAKELWYAKTAEEWKRHYLEKGAGQSKRPPSVGDLFRDMNLLSTNYQRLDVQYAMSIYLHGFWTLILEYRQLTAVLRARSYSNNPTGNPNLLLTSRWREMCQDLQNFQLLTSGLPEPLSPQENLLINLLMMNLNVSFDDLQLFSGKEGEEQARRIYPILQEWTGSIEARHTLWHAGQIMRQAKLFPQGHLKDFYAVAVHHAALAFWTYGVVTKAIRRPPPDVQFGAEPICLDGVDSQPKNRFITFGQGRPMLEGPVTKEGTARCPVEDTKACMDIAQEILKANFAGGQEGLPLIVENLCHLIKQLGSVAWTVGPA
jgi:hypothetical protein